MTEFINDPSICNAQMVNSLWSLPCKTNIDGYLGKRNTMQQNQIHQTHTEPRRGHNHWIWYLDAEHESNLSPQRDESTWHAEGHAHELADSAG